MFRLIISLLLLVYSSVVVTAQDEGVNFQHCKPKTITRTRTVTKFNTTPAARTTVLGTTTPAKVTITVTKSAAKITVTKDGLKTVTVSQAIPSARADKIVQVSGFLGDGGVCDLTTGKPKNESDAGYNILLSRGI
jgi:hypothetical protein